MAITQVGSANQYNSGTGATTGGMTVTCPSGITTNDVLVVGMDAAVNVSPPASGWTQLAIQTSNVNSGLWYRICDGSETGGSTTYNFGTASNSKWAGWILALRGVDTAQIVDNSGAAIATNNQTSTSTTATFNSVTTVTDGCYIILAGFARNSTNNQTGNSWGAVSGYSELADTWSTQASTGIVGNNGVVLDTATQATHGTVSSATSTTARSNFFFNVTVAFKPIPPAVNVTIDPNTFTDSTSTSEVGQGWTAVTIGGGTATAARSSTQAHSGTWSTQVTASIASSGFTATAQTASGPWIAVSPGQTLRVGGWVYTTGAGRQARVTVDLYQSDQSTLVTTLGSFASLITPTQNAWSYVSDTLVVPAGLAAYAVFNVLCVVGSGDNWYLDDPFVWIANGSVTAAPAGTVTAASSTPATVAGVVAAASAAAAAGSVTAIKNATISGVVSSATTAAPAGAVTATRTATIAGVLAVTSTAASAGTVTGNATVTGVVAGSTTAAPTGTVSTASTATIAGVTAGVATAASAGSITATRSVTIAGVVAGTTTAATAGTVSSGVTIAGPVATAATAASAGTISGTANVTGITASTTFAAPAGTPGAGSAATITGVTTNLSNAAPAGTVSATTNVTIAGPATGLAAAAQPGSVVTSVVVAGPSTNVAVSAPAGSVTAVSHVTITGSVATLHTAAGAGRPNISIPTTGHTGKAQTKAAVFRLGTLTKVLTAGTLVSVQAAGSKATVQVAGSLLRVQKNNRVVATVKNNGATRVGT